MGMRTPDASPPHELAALRRQITELVVQNAVPMVQQAIDAVREEGQYQAMKYLFEMIGFYPAATQDHSPQQDSLARILLAELGLPEADETTEEAKRKRPVRVHPVK